MPMLALEAACTVRVLIEGATASTAGAYRDLFDSAKTAGISPPCPRCFVLGNIGVLNIRTISRNTSVAKCAFCSCTLQFSIPGRYVEE